MNPASVPDIVNRLGGVGRLTEARVRALIASLSPSDAIAMLFDWDLWRLPYQGTPPGDWRTWVFRAGRGTGKNHTGSRTTTSVAMDKDKIRGGVVGIAGRTETHVRVAMIEGPSGILATSPPAQRPRWEPGLRKLTWPNGTKGYVMYGEKPAGFRSFNTSWLWADELDFWPKNAIKTWDEDAMPALRMGWARAMITTTPRPGGAVKEIESRKSSVTTRASTYDNPFLARSALEEFLARYEGTRAGRQELHAEHLTAGALWDMDSIANNRVVRLPSMSMIARVVVAIDPAGTDDEDNDATGIYVCAVDRNDRGYVIEDATCHASPGEWGSRAVALYRKWGADLIVGENNFGGNMVEGTIRAVDPRVLFKSIRSSRGKWLRAEPVAALYEKGRVSHVGVHEELEDEMLTFGPNNSSRGGKSPNRLDAVVFALTELMISDEPVYPSPAAYLHLDRL